jgi:hypothetical protein
MNSEEVFSLLIESGANVDSDIFVRPNMDIDSWDSDRDTENNYDESDCPGALD